MALVLNTRLVPSTGVVIRELPDAVVALDTQSGGVFELNRTGGIVWGGVAAGRTLGEIAADLAGKGGVELATVERDVLGLADQIVAAGLARLA